MARKNSNGIKRRNRSRYGQPPPKGPRLAPIPIEHVVVPVGKCYLNHKRGKLQFTRAQVDRALLQAQHNRAMKGSKHVEERYYECDAPGGCRMWHLTSQAPRA